MGAGGIVSTDISRATTPNPDFPPVIHSSNAAQTLIASLSPDDVIRN